MRVPDAVTRHVNSISSDAIRGAIAMLVTLAVFGYPLFGVEVTAEMWSAWGLVVGFYFARRANGDSAKLTH